MIRLVLVFGLAMGEVALANKSRLAGFDPAFLKAEFDQVVKSVSSPRGSSSYYITFEDGTMASVSRVQLRESFLVYKNSLKTRASLPQIRPQARPQSQPFAFDPVSTLDLPAINIPEIQTASPGASFEVVIQKAPTEHKAPLIKPKVDRRAACAESLSEIDRAKVDKKYGQDIVSFFDRTIGLLHAGVSTEKEMEIISSNFSHESWTPGIFGSKHRNELNALSAPERDEVGFATSVFVVRRYTDLVGIMKPEIIEAAEKDYLGLPKEKRDFLKQNPLNTRVKAVGETPCSQARNRDLYKCRPKEKLLVVTAQLAPDVTCNAVVGSDTVQKAEVQYIVRADPKKGFQILDVESKSFGVSLVKTLRQDFEGSLTKKLHVSKELMPVLMKKASIRPNDFQVWKQVERTKQSLRTAQAVR